MLDQITLEQAIKLNDELYRKGTPTISDSDYDLLVEDLKQRFPNSELLKKGVIKQYQKESRKEKLPIPMYSLNKCKSVEEVKSWLRSINCENDVLIITPKYDGISLVTVESEDKCWTRGDGEVGQVSDSHFSKLNDKHCGTDIIAFGEAIMSKKNFEKYKGKFANPRNMVAGLFNRDEAGEELKDVDYIRYGSSMVCNKTDQLTNLNRINDVPVLFETVSSNLILKGLGYNVEDLFDNLYNKWSKDYQIDGLVIEVNDWSVRGALGREENMNPKYARAIKLPKWSESATVEVIGIEWGVSKQGKLKPVINIEPTEVAGVTISNVTGYNAKYIIDNEIAIDSVIEIVRSGDVIPKHILTINSNKNQLERLMDEISICPSCGEPVKWDETMTELVCLNPECGEKRIQKLVHFFTTLGVEEFGEPTIRKFYEEANFETIESILNANEYTLTGISGWGSKSTQKLLTQLSKLKNEGVSLAKLLHAYDVFEGKIGEKTCQLILDNIEPSKLNKIGTSISIQELTTINGVSDITAQVFLVGYRRFEMMNSSIMVSYITTPKAEVIGDKYKGAKICFTGCRPTKEQEQMIQEQGGEVVSGVSGKTTHLVVKDVNSSSDKMQKAKSLGIKILSIKEL